MFSPQKGSQILGKTKPTFEILTFPVKLKGQLLHR